MQRSITANMDMAKYLMPKIKEFVYKSELNNLIPEINFRNKCFYYGNSPNFVFWHCKLIGTALKVPKYYRSDSGGSYSCQLMEPHCLT